MNDGLPGTLGVGGRGGVGGAGGGGGGGGYFGGGGGEGHTAPVVLLPGGGGGGGSAFPVNAIHEPGIRSGNGIVTITYGVPSGASPSPSGTPGASPSPSGVPGNPVVVTQNTTATVGVAGSCDPLYSPCGGSPPSPAGQAPLAPSPGEEGGAVVGHARMPNLRASVEGRWDNGMINVTVRVLISNPNLVKRWFVVRVRIPWLEQTRLVRVSAQGRRVRTVHLPFGGPASVIGKLVVARVDATDRILETRNSDNTGSARIT